MTREEFEIWIEDKDRVSEAIDRLPKGDRSIDKWLKAFALNLNEIAQEESSEPEEDLEEGLAEDLDEDLGVEPDDED